ncbi:hypothetical protein A8B82_08425 [Sulfitobacter sp. EhC04]|uniref:alpha/beta hydrolase n=1 Tax=Sulfitobacter sp. EhC04 TaxID=1849168 RepID=UPI0007F43D3C|nr:alpha/beta hydrolase [Sulfitobacter sp. EhC04]OAN79150.1 hypothetical protein A8B82_08425 [Sulfitobacter sp. EhC04]
MEPKSDIDPQVWSKATEHIADHRGVTGAANDSSGLLASASLLAPSQSLLDRIGMAAAFYGKTGARIGSDERFPLTLPEAPGGGTRTARGRDGTLLLFHSVVLNGDEQTFCLSLDLTSLHAFLPGTSKLTPSEFVVLAGLVDGQSIRDLADSDGVSYNTRRRQSEAVLEKLGVNSQTEAVRMVLMTVVDRVLSALQEDHTRSRPIEDLGRCYGDTVRFHWIHLAGGPPLRVADIGDPLGTPVLLHHPMLFPCGVVPSAAREVTRAGLRLIVPFRPGFLDAPQWEHALRPADVLAAWSERCAALTSFLNLRRVHTASISFSASWAADFAMRHPNRVESVTFISAPQPSHLWSPEVRTASFIHSVGAIVERAPWLAGPVARLHAIQIKDIPSALRGFRKSFANCPADIADVDRLATDPLGVQTIVTTIKESVSGIATDLRVLRQPWETFLAGLDIPLHFVHGLDDRTSSATLMEDFARTLPQATWHGQLGQGHLMALHDLPRLLSASIGRTVR